MNVSEEQLVRVEQLGQRQQEQEFQKEKVIVVQGRIRICKNGYQRCISAV